MIIREGEELLIPNSQGEEAFRLRVEDDVWKVHGPKGSALLFDWPVVQLFTPWEFSEGQLADQIGILEKKWQEDMNFRAFFDYVPEVIEGVYPIEDRLQADDSSWEGAAKQAKLCRLLLTFLNADGVRQERYNATLLALRRIYYHALAHLYEQEEHIKKSDLRFYLEGWDLEREYRAALRIWISICLNDANAWLFRDVLPVSREEEMKAILCLRDAQGRHHLRRFFREEQTAKRGGREFVEHLVERWFLRRYDLGFARRLLHTILQEHSPGLLQDYPLWRLPYIGLPLGILFFLVALKPVQDWLRLGIGGVYCLTWLISVICYLFLGIGVSIALLRQPAWLRVILPRLIVGIIVGYLPLVFTSDSWQNPIQSLYRPDPRALWGFLFVILGSLVFSFVYLQSEIHKILQDAQQARRRAMPIFLQGLSFSFMLGIALTELLGTWYTSPGEFVGLHLVERIFLFQVSGAFGGYIYPAGLSVLVCLALFIGIFAQLLWQEKQITEPLR